MNEADIEIALKARLGMNFFDLPVIYPNDTAPVGVEYVVVQIERFKPTDRTLRGTSPKRPGLLTITIVSPQGETSAEGTRQADTIAALYPMGLRLPFTGGSIEIPSHPFIRGFKQGANWRTAVIIDFTAM